MTYHKTAVVTGASSGIGKATARRLAKEGYALVLCGRRLNRLEELQTELAELVPVTILTFDVGKSTEVERAFDELPEAFSQIELLINNAGNAHGLEPIQEGNIADWDAMIDSNVKGVLYVSNRIIPIMLNRGKGTIINIGSIAGKEVYPNGNVYCATKHAVDSLTKGMRLDLNSKGIRVAAVHPGLVETEFSQVRFKGDLARAEHVYKGYTPLQAEDIADLIGFMVTRPAHVSISDVTILASAQANATQVTKQLV